MVRKHQRLINILQVFLDTLCLLTAYLFAIQFKLNITGFEGFRSVYYWASLWIVALLIIIYYFMGVYTPMRTRRFRREVLIVTRAHFFGIVLLLSTLFLFKNIDFSREVPLIFGVSGLLLVIVERYALRKTLRYYRGKGFNLKHILVVGAGPVGCDFANSINEHKYFGYNIVGFLDDDEAKWNTQVLGVPVLGGCSKLLELLASGEIDEVIVALPLKAYGKYGKIIDSCEDAGIRVRLIPDYNRYLPGKPVIENFDGIPLLNIRKIPLDDPFYRFVKRVTDLFIASIAIALTGPLMICIAIATKLTSPGPVFFKQTRVGMDNQTFEMLKFRSMRVADDQSGDTVWTTSEDPRKTKFGSFLRKTSLDELPQFFNVFAGSMSVIGPRPERPFFVEQFREEIPRYMVKHQVKPGITGWAQVNGWRGDTSIEKRIECDLYYIENWDFLLDLKIIFLTFFKGLVNRNAY